MAVCLIDYEGISPDLADFAYEKISGTLATEGEQTNRGCQTNKTRSCACQGLSKEEGGASYSFGCSYNYFNGSCKFWNSGEEPRTFNLNKTKKKGKEEEDLKALCDKLSDCVAPLLEDLAPDCHQNMTLFSEVASDCRLGSSGGRPFSGVTAVTDFCAHSHRDKNNMVGGCTVVVSLTRPHNRGLDRPEDEQFHVLPLYQPDATQEEIRRLEDVGGLEMLDRFRRTITIFESPIKPVKRGTPSAEKKKLLDGNTKKKRTENQKVNKNLYRELKEDKADTVTNSSSNEASVPVEDNNLVLPALLSEPHTESQPQHRFQLPTSPIHPQFLPFLQTPQFQTHLPPQFSLHDPQLAPPQGYPSQYQPSLPSLNPLTRYETFSIPQNPPPLLPTGYRPPQNPPPNYETHRQSQNPWYDPPQIFQANDYNQSVISSIESMFDPYLRALLENSQLPQMDGTIDDDDISLSDQRFRLLMAQIRNESQETPLNLSMSQDQSIPRVQHEAREAEEVVQTKLKHELGEAAGEEIASVKMESTQMTPTKLELEEGHEVKEGMEARKVLRSYLTDCAEAFKDVHMGGLALSLPHGSILVEVAKEELHATTALKEPNRKNPCRVGLVFYQHVMLHLPHHGYEVIKRKNAIKEHKDYLSWLAGKLNWTNYTTPPPPRPHVEFSTPSSMYHQSMSLKVSSCRPRPS